MSTSDGDRSEAASLADSMAEGPAEFEVNGIRPPDEAAANNAAPSEAGTPPEAQAQPALPAEALDFINASMSKEAAADVVAVLKRRGVTTPAMLESLDPDNCTILADDLADKANRLGLRAVGRFYEEKAAKRRRTVASTKERDFETLLRRLQDECAGKYDGFRVPGRFLLPPNLFFRLQKGEEVHLDQLLVSSAAAGDTSHKFTFDTEAQTFKVEDVSGKSKPPVCQSAGLMLSMARWGLSASLLNQLQPIHALCYMARVAEACLNCAGGISVMKAIDIDMRSEARRGSSTSPLGVQLTQEFGDIVARHSAAGQVAACLSTSSRTHSSDKNGYSGSGRGHNQDRLCHYFPLGKCHAGNRCKFKHVTPEQPAGRKVNGPKDSHQRSDTGASASQSATDKRSGATKRRRTTDEPTHRDLANDEEAHQLVQVVESWCDQARRAVQEDLFNDENYKDGGFSTLPDQELPAGVSEKALQVGSEIGEIILEEARGKGLTDVLRSLQGAPSEEQAATLKRKADSVAEKCRGRIAHLLQAPNSPPSNGNHIHCDILQALAVALGDQDVQFASLCKDGLPIGITEEIPPCSLYPAYHPKPQQVYEKPGEHRNYKSMNDSEARDCVEKTLEEEQRCGFIRRLSEEEANDPGRTFTPRAALPKGEKASDGYRIIDDFLRSNTNLAAAVPNTNTLPGVRDLRRLAGSLLDRFPGSEVAPFKLDLKSAYRQLGVRPSERKHLCFMHEFGDGTKAWFENLSLPFGLNSSGYWFVRFASLAQRCITVVLKGIMKHRGILPAIGGLQYVDDGFWLLLKSFYYEAATIIIMMWHLIGAPVSFPKVRMGANTVDCIGVTVEVTSTARMSFSIREAKVSKLRAMLADLLRSERVSLRDLRSITGKLTHYTQLQIFLRAYTQPFHALEAAMTRKKLIVAKCPRSSEIGCIAGFFHRLLGEARSLVPVGPLGFRTCTRASTVTIMADASTRAVGGVLARCAGEPSDYAVEATPKPDVVKYFQLELSASTLGEWTCLLKDPTIPEESRNITAFELVAVCLSLITLEREFGQLGSFNVVIYTDNEAVRHILSRLYSRTPALAKLLRCMAGVLAKMSTTAFVTQRISTEENTAADMLSRVRTPKLPDTWEKVDVNLALIEGELT